MNRKTNEGLAAYAKKALAEGWRYWYGATGVKCTPELLRRKTAQYPAHYASGRMARCSRDIAEGRFCADCIGLAKGYMWLDEDTGRQAYKANGCPDASANGMFAQASEKGDIASMPDVPGLIVRFNGHAGIYVGGGNVIEARGFNYGVVQTEIDRRPWTHWYRLPGLIYEGAAKPAEYLPGDRILRRGLSGGDVKRAQEMLLTLGYALPIYGADGDYGAETENAVRAFQKAANLAVDGLCGPKTIAALIAQCDETHPESGDAPVETVTVDRETIIRRGPGETFEALTVAEAGMALTRVSCDGWIPVLIDGQTGWLAGSAGSAH